MSTQNAHADEGNVTLTNFITTDDTACDRDWCPGPRETADDPLPCFDCYHVLEEEAREQYDCRH
ncbi:hypothetical protein C475_08852 [Halosimplex carlsbadense 2-9-1]|uniref:Uncharacterized protein n=1 Tax=Halosimplex carlsbadense 2-9-1 TaxID=797114 RepID=M0CVT8_9EURY|nr:hypothetical protein [Halosimplex carlsbadense]ELZ26522.1 hypothetical protein C475_08852 [Halosimplex carlsbadense 2-9-1]